MVAPRRARERTSARVLAASRSRSRARAPAPSHTTRARSPELTTWEDAAPLLGAWERDDAASDSQEPLFDLLDVSWSQRQAEALVTQLLLEEDDATWRLTTRGLFGALGACEAYPKADGELATLALRGGSEGTAAAGARPVDGGVQLTHALPPPRAGRLREWLGVTHDAAGDATLVRYATLELYGTGEAWEGIAVYRRPGAPPLQPVEPAAEEEAEAAAAAESDEDEAAPPLAGPESTAAVAARAAARAAWLAGRDGAGADAAAAPPAEAAAPQHEREPSEASDDDAASASQGARSSGGSDASEDEAPRSPRERRRRRRRAAAASAPLGDELASWDDDRAADALARSAPLSQRAAAAAAADAAAAAAQREQEQEEAEAEAEESEELFEIRPTRAMVRLADALFDAMPGATAGATASARAAAARAARAAAAERVIVAAAVAREALQRSSPNYAAAAATAAVAHASSASAGGVGSARSSGLDQRAQLAEWMEQRRRGRAGDIAP